MVDPSPPTIRPWLAEFSSPAQELAFRAHEISAGKRAFYLAALAIVAGDLGSAWFDWQRFSSPAPDSVWRLMAVRASVLVAAALLAAGARWWPKPKPMAWTMLCLCLVVSLMQAVVTRPGWPRGADGPPRPVLRWRDGRN